MDKLDLSEAITALSNGEIIVYPTDTLYGLGADIYNNKAVEKVFKFKKRPYTMPLSIAVYDFKSLEKIAYTNHKIKNLVKFFLPGKLTLILYKKSCISDLITAGLDKIAVRIPNNQIALEILSSFGPITATSANIHGQKTPIIIKDIKLQLREKNISVYIDAGKLDGKPSTIVDLTNNKIKIIREGAISKEDILDAILNE
jgi:L-threonylcarbamoyladenylate synthase